MTYIVGHVSPDWDCITALWLLQRFGPFDDARIELVNTGAPDPAVLAGAAAVVDTGQELDPQRWRFDHHQLEGEAANATCAAQLVHAWLCVEHELRYLDPLIELVFAGDTGKPEAAQSRKVGIHALLSAMKHDGETDTGLIEFGYALLDGLAAHLKRADEARRSLNQYTIYRSADGRFVALEQSSRAAVQAAYEAGVRLVLWHRSFPHTETIELWRGGDGPAVDCGAVVRTAIADPSLPADELDELSSWYLHEAGFYAGRGSDKAPDGRPLACAVVDLAQAIDTAWER